MRTAFKGLAVLGLAFGMTAAAQAAARISLEGVAEGARYGDANELRISLIDWSPPEQVDTVLEAWRAWRDSNQIEDFMATLEQADTQGYLFTAAAVGYSIKYAWEDPATGRMVFLVTPGLKTRNPGLWQEASSDERPFTLLELEWQGEMAVVKSSLGAEIVADGDVLRLADPEAAEVFAQVQDTTPYYLREAS